MKSSRRFNEVSFLISLGVLFAGLAFCIIEWKVGVPQAILICVGLLGAIVFISALKKSSFKTISQKIGFILKVFILICAVVVLNLFVSQRNVRFDMTVLKQHTLSPNTIKLLDSLKSPVQITVFHVGLPPKYLDDLLKEYERLSKGKVKTEIIDPLVEIGYASSFGSVISGKEKKAIVRSAGERRDIDFTESPLSEDQLDNAIARTTRKAKTAYFLSGHGEYDLFGEKENGLGEFNKILLANNILTKKLLLTKGGEVPSDCDLIVIAGPQQELTKDEEKTILGYLDRGGDALFLIENIILTTPDVPLKESDLNRNPSLNRILEKWGVRIATDVVIDVGSHAGGDVGSPATKNYMSHRAIVSGLDYTFYVRPRSIAMVKDRRETIKIAPLVLTVSSDQSWGETNRSLQIKYDEDSDRPGPVPMAFVMTEPKSDKKTSDTRAAVFTDADFISNAYIDQLSNAQMGLNVVKWLLEDDYFAFVPQKDIVVQELNLVSHQKRIIVVILLALSLSVPVLGLMLWFKDERK